MERWDEKVQEEHHALESQVGALEATLKIDVGVEDRRITLKWIIRTLEPALQLHLRKEEEVLFPALQRLLGENAGAVTILKEQHRELRASMKHVAELLENRDNISWEAIGFSAQAFVDLLEDHEKKEDRLLIDVLEFSLKPKELKELARAFGQVAWKVYKEEM